jgi:hypothetical protein
MQGDAGIWAMHLAAMSISPRQGLLSSAPLQVMTARCVLQFAFCDSPCIR